MLHRFSKTDCCKENKDFSIRNVNVWLTEKCCFRCIYCYEKPYEYKPKVLDEKLIPVIIDWLLHMSKNGTVSISLFGGEPLLEWELIKKFNEFRLKLMRVRNRRINLGIVSNIYLLDDEKLDYLVRNDIGILVSIDGCQKTMAIHRGIGDYENRMKMGEIVIENAKKILSKFDKRKITARMTWTYHNLPFLLNDFKFLYSLGFTNIFHAYPDDNFRNLTEDELKQYELIMLQDTKRWFKEIKNIPLSQISQKMNRFYYTSPCGAGKGFAGIDTEGNVFPCHRFIFWKKWQIGNVYTTQTNLEKRKLFFNYNNKIISEKCRTCRHQGCGGQCFASSYEKYKDIYAIDDFQCKINDIHWRLIYDLRNDEEFCKMFKIKKPLMTDPNIKPKVYDLDKLVKFSLQEQKK